MYCASDSELNVAVIWIGFVDYMAISGSTTKDDLIPIRECDKMWNFVRADLTEQVFPLIKRQFSATSLQDNVHLVAILDRFDTPRQFMITVVGVRFRIECIARMVDVVDYFIYKRPSGKCFERL